MFYEIEVVGHVRIPPNLLDQDINSVILDRLNAKYDNYISSDFGVVVVVSELLDVGEGVIIPGDGAAYYETRFKLVIFKPELQELVLGKLTEITDFGAFMEIGPIDGMIHISQTMDDYVSFTKQKTLTGKETKRTLKAGDRCRARIIAVSYKDVSSPKIGLTMRQPSLGALSWLEEEIKKQKKEEGKKWLQKKHAKIAKYL